MNKNKILFNFLKSVNFSFNLLLIEEADNLVKDYNASTNILQRLFLAENEPVSSFKNKEEMIVAIKNNFFESFPKPIADSLIEANLPLIEKSVNCVFDFEQNFALVKEKLNKEYQELNKVLKFNLLDIVEDSAFDFGSGGICREAILKNFNKNTSAKVLFDNILFILEKNL